MTLPGEFRSAAVEAGPLSTRGGASLESRRLRRVDRFGNCREMAESLKRRASPLLLTQRNPSEVYAKIRRTFC